MNLIYSMLILISYFTASAMITVYLYNFYLRIKNPPEKIFKAEICWIENNDMDLVIKTLVKDFKEIDGPSIVTKEENAIIACISKVYRLNRELEKGTAVYYVGNQVYYFDPPQKDKNLNIN